MTSQRVDTCQAQEVDLVFDQHDLARAVRRIDTAGGVGDDQSGDTEEFHQADGHGACGEGVALVEVEAALHADHGGGPDMAEEEAPSVTHYGTHGEVGDVFVIEFGGVGDGIAQRS